jgi:transposase
MSQLYGLRPASKATITIMKENSNSELIAWIGLDWGDKSHAFALADSTGKQEVGTLEHSAEALHHWLQGLAQRYGGRSVAIALEASRGAVLHALLEYPWLVIYPINPTTSAHYRRAFRPSGAKDDLPDAQVLLDLVRHHADKLRAFEVPDATTQTLNRLLQLRRDLVDRRTQTLNQLTSLLKSYYPQALTLAGDLNSNMALDFLGRWSDLLALKAARPSTLRQFYYRHNVRRPERVKERLERIKQSLALTTDLDLIATCVMQLRFLLDQLRVFKKHIGQMEQDIKEAFAQHPEAYLFKDLPGAGPQLAPRLCVAFAMTPNALSSPSSLQKMAGIAPVVEKSGNQVWTHWRWFAPAFLRQSFVEWAGQTVVFSTWARHYYQRMKAKGKGHHAIMRALAFKWIRILWKCWHTRTPYNEQRYLQQLLHRKSPNALALG